MSHEFERPKVNLVAPDKRKFDQVKEILSAFELVNEYGHEIEHRNIFLEELKGASGTPILIAHTWNSTIRILNPDTLVQRPQNEAIFIEMEKSGENNQLKLEVVPLDFVEGSIVNHSTFGNSHIKFFPGTKQASFTHRPIGVLENNGGKSPKDMIKQSGIAQVIVFADFTAVVSQKNWGGLFILRE